MAGIRLLLDGAAEIGSEKATAATERTENTDKKHRNLCDLWCSVAL
jgi:hypothetical protein